MVAVEGDGAQMKRSQAQLCEKLTERVHLLRKSVDSFYKGDMAESLNIANSIRQLVHDTKSSTALLKQLTTGYEGIPISTPIGPVSSQLVDIDKQLGSTLLYLGVGLNVSPEKVLPMFDLSAPFYKERALGWWWGNIVLVIPYDKASNGRVSYSTRKIVLTVCNKDGGAHIDPELPEEYQHLLTSNPVVINLGPVQSTSIDVAKFAVGQSGAELLAAIETKFPFVIEK